MYRRNPYGILTVSINLTSTGTYVYPPTGDVTSLHCSPPALVCEGGVHARSAQHPDVALLGADGEQPLHGVPGHGRGFVGVAVHQRPLEAEVRRVDPLHDLGLHLVGDA